MADTFTPEQITQILEEFFKVVGTRRYVGERYVPIFGRKGEESIEWDNSAPYEPLTIVLYQGNSYTSRQYVPIGVDITNQEFWAITGNYNAQVEAYHRETIAAREIADNAITIANNAQNDIDTLLPKADFSAENTVKKYIDEKAIVQDGSITAEKLADGAVTDTKLAHIEIAPSDFPTMPYKVTRSMSGYYTVEDILASKETSDFYHYYVDSVNGSDSNAGTSADAPVKSLKKALTLGSNKDAYISIAEGSVIWDDGLYGEYLVRKSLVIDGNGSTLIWGVQDAGWTAYEGKAGVYVSADLSAKVCINCVDMSEANKDMYGFYKGMKPVISVDAMVENTYFWDATNKVMYAYPRDGGSITDIHPLRASYGLRWNHLLATVDTFMYLRNFEYIGSYFDSVRTTSTSQTIKYEGYFENLRLSHGANGDQLPVSNYDVAYIWGCKVGWTKQDAFNHHMTGFIDTSRARDCVCVVVNCEATEAGWYETGSANTHNLYTAHEGMSVLRCNCNGNNSKGPLLADVNGCRSINIDCQLVNAGYASSTFVAALSFNDVQAIQAGFITLQRVNARDASHPSIAGLNCDCKLNMWDCVIAGTTTISKELAVTPDL